MRKKTIDNVLDMVFWYILYSLPFICFILYIANGQTITMLDFMTSIGVNLNTNNILFTGIMEIFGSNGILPLFTDINVVYYVVWFISVYLLHLFVDIILFIPRLAEKFLDRGLSANV